MLQIITRVADMQMNLEHPEERAKNMVQDRLTINSKGEIELPEIASDVLIRIYSLTCCYRLAYLEVHRYHD